MSAHRCTQRTEGWCGWCENAAERAAEIRDERNDFTTNDGPDEDWHHARGPYYPRGL